MSLKPEAALRKDTRVTAKVPKFQHQHYAFIATSLFHAGASESVCRVVAARLRDTNPRFDETRFLRACGVLTP